MVWTWLRISWLQLMSASISTTKEPNVPNCLVLLLEAFVKVKVGIEPQVLAIGSPHPSSECLADLSDAWIGRRGQEREDEFDKLRWNFWRHGEGFTSCALTPLAFKACGLLCACRNPTTSWQLSTVARSTTRRCTPGCFYLDSLTSPAETSEKVIRVI